jgi:membrane protease YdiL (CAAX protease family)
VDTRKRLLREVLILLALYLLPSVSAPAGLQTLAGNAHALVAITIRNVAFVLLIIYLADLREERREILGPVHTPVSIIVTTAVVWGTLLASSTVTAWIASYFTDPVSTTATIVPALRERYAAWVWIPLLSITMLSVGVVEELFFRSYLLHRLRALGLTPVHAIGTAAILFSIGHMYQGASAAAFSLIAGVLLGFLWIRRPSFGAFALGHSLYNLGVLLISAV